MSNSVTYDSAEQFMDAAEMDAAGISHLHQDGTEIVIRDFRGKEFRFTIATKKERGGKTVAEYYDHSFFYPGQTAHKPKLSSAKKD